MDIAGKRISIIGAERSGIAAAKLAKRRNAVPFISDMAPEEKLMKQVYQLTEAGILFETGGHTERIYDADLIVVSPGVPSHAAVFEEAKKRGIPVEGELEFAWRFCKSKVIAITGTNGKTTTTSLVAYILEKAGIASVAAGNIGVAFSDVVDTLDENGVFALEVSSFQLDTIRSFNPQVGMILNITPDHLNRYDNSFEKYAAAKYRMFENQDEEDIIIINDDDPVFSRMPLQPKSKVYRFSLTKENDNGAYMLSDLLICHEEKAEIFRILRNEILLPGEHNLQNVMAAVIACKKIGAGNDAIAEALRTFPGVEHRLEFVAEIDGVRYVNDSKATNVESVWYALRSFEQPLFLILGGLDKGNDYTRIEQLVKDKAKKIYAIGQSAETVFKFFHKEIKVEIKSTMDECVLAANSEAREGDVVLLSPACASFDMYSGYEERGRVFKAAVRRMVQ